MKTKFYELAIGDYFVLPDQERLLLMKTWDDHAEHLTTGESVLVNPDDYVIPAENT